MSERGDGPGAGAAEPAPAVMPPELPRPRSRRQRIRRTLGSAPQFRDMVIVHELLSPPVGLRNGHRF